MAALKLHMHASVCICAMNCLEMRINMKKSIKKLIFAMIMICFINTIYNAFLLFSHYDTRDNYELILNRYVSDEDKMSKLSADVYKMQSLTLAQMISEDDVKVVSLTKQIEEMHNSNIKLLKKLKDTITTDDEKEIIRI